MHRSTAGADDAEEHGMPRCEVQLRTLRSARRKLLERTGITTHSRASDAPPITSPSTKGSSCGGGAGGGSGAGGCELDRETGSRKRAASSWLCCHVSSRSPPRLSHVRSTSGKERRSQRRGRLAAASPWAAGDRMPHRSETAGRAQPTRCARIGDVAWCAFFYIIVPT